MTKIHDPRRDKKEKTRKENQTQLTENLKFAGMMCTHCEATVRKALEALSQVREVAVGCREGTAVVTLTVPVEDAVLRKAVEDQGYQVVSID